MYLHFPLLQDLLTKGILKWMRIFFLLCTLAIVHAASLPTSFYTILGLNNIRPVETVPYAHDNTTRGFNRWLQASLEQSDQKPMNVEHLKLFLYSSSSSSLSTFNMNFLSALEQLWDNGSVPLIEWMVSPNPQAEPALYTSMLINASNQGTGYNSVLLQLYPSLFQPQVELFVSEVLVPFLSNGRSMGHPHRRLYISFAPQFNTNRFPWGESYTSSPSLVTVHNDAASYASLWNAILVKSVLRPIFAAMRTFDRDMNDLSTVVQCIWTAAAPLPTSNTIPLDAWFPQWSCTNLSSSSFSLLCGPDWVGMYAVNLGLYPGVESFVSPLLSALTSIAATKNGTLHRNSLLAGAPIPIAILGSGCTSLQQSGGGSSSSSSSSGATTVDTNAKDSWMVRLLAIALLNPYVKLLTLQNTRAIEVILGGPVVQAHLEVFSLDDHLCCDKVDPLTGAFVLDDVSDVIVNGSNDGYVALAQDPSLTGCHCPTLFDDATFVGAFYDPSTQCKCVATPSEDDSIGKRLQRVFTDPIVDVSVAVALLLVTVFLVWRQRFAASQETKQRLMLGRYVVRRILHHCKQFSSVLVAFDTAQNTEVIVKQYVVTSDCVSALANNEIEKYRSCQGFPHIVQLVQSTFAWKQRARSKSVASSSSAITTISSMRTTTTATVGANIKGRDDKSRAGSRKKQKNRKRRDTNVVINDRNASRIPFAIVVMKKYSSGDLKCLLARLREMQEHPQTSNETSLANATAAAGRRECPLATSLSFHECVSLILQLLIALHTLHEVVRPGDPMLHRDVKPENIFLERRPLRNRPSEFVYLLYLGDFGCAVYRSQLSTVTLNDTLDRQDLDERNVDVSRTFLTTRNVGTSKYMPPEAREGNYSPAGDVWSAGCILYSLVLNKTPDDFFAAIRDNDEFLLQAKQLFTREALHPLWLADLMCQMLHVDPNRRPTAAECIRAIQRGMTQQHNASSHPTVEAVMSKARFEEVYGDPSPLEEECVPQGDDVVDTMIVRTTDELPQEQDAHQPLIVVDEQETNDNVLLYDEELMTDSEEDEEAASEGQMSKVHSEVDWNDDS